MKYYKGCGCDNHLRLAWATIKLWSSAALLCFVVSTDYVPR